MDWHWLLAFAALVLAGMAFYNNLVLQQRVRRLEELTGHRIPGEPASGVTPPSETR